MESYRKFNEDESHRDYVIAQSSQSIGADNERMRYYFENEVMNTLDEESMAGLLRFLIEVCELKNDPTWVSI